MRKPFSLGRIAAESILFQEEKKFFFELSDTIARLRTKKVLADASTKKFFADPALEELAAVIKKRTNIKVYFADGAATGPAVYTPTINKNHTFYTTDQKELYEFFEHDTEEDIKKLMRSVKRKVVYGEVDLSVGKVHGAFEQMEFKMLMPKDMLLESQFTPEEVAAVMLHETGHIFTFCEFANRTISTNQCISNLIRVLDKSISSDRRKIIFQKAGEEMKMTPAETALLKEADSNAAITAIVLDHKVEESISEVGYSVYDVNSCEYLADQFATRMGAGRHLVTGLDKIFRMYGATDTWRFWGNMISFLWIVAGAIATAGFSLLIAIPLILLTTNKENEIYDNPHARMQRIKHQIIEQLKDKNLDPKIRESLLEDQEVIDAISKSDYTDSLDIYEKLAWVCKPSFRRAHRMEQLQKQLERFASNSLFVSAAKLRSV